MKRRQRRVHSVVQDRVKTTSDVGAIEFEWQPAFVAVGCIRRSGGAVSLSAPRVRAPGETEC